MEKENKLAVEGEGGRDGEEEKDKKPDESTPKDHRQQKERLRNDEKASSTSSSPPPVLISISISRSEEEFSSDLPPKLESGTLLRSDSYHEVCR